jgi:UDP-N-acetyl-D-mannosaminuronate dehydrogenase
VARSGCAVGADSLNGGSIEVVTRKDKVVVAGLGEVGKPLFQLVSERHDAIGVDVEPVEGVTDVDVLHVCYPFQIADFIGETARYIGIYRPALTIVNSTVTVGTTRAIADRTGAAVVNSPVRGKHARMLDELRMYTKFIGATDPAAARQAAAHFESLGLATKTLPSPEATELAKLAETTYFGVMIAWAQDLERYCDRFGQDYGDIVSFYDEIKFFPPVKYYPGVIGGHCVMQNIKLLSAAGHSSMLEAVRASNRMKIEREARRSDAAAAA